MLLNRKVHSMWDRNFDSCLEMLYYIHQKDKSNSDERSFRISYYCCV